MDVLLSITTMDSILKNIKNVYFLGIGGIGMSALARYFKLNGFQVAGYDRTPSILTRIMSDEEGIAVTYDDDVDAIAEKYKDTKDTLVVYTPAVPADNRQYVYFRDGGFQLKKRAEVLGILSRSGKALCIAGTHGKTTTSTLLAFLLKNSSVGCNAFLGGISSNFGTNLLTDPNSDYIVIEADEYDRSFLHLHPEVAVITAMDADHLDIYKNKENVTEAFETFAKNVKPGGKLFIKQGLALKDTEVTGDYNVDYPADYYADGLRVVDGRYHFNYHGQGVEIKDLCLGIPGRVNVENAVAAVTVALSVGMTPDEIRRALPEFRGVARRFNIHVHTEKMMYIDDYAHHPREIEAVLSSVRAMWPDRKLTVSFQPHLYSRTNDFYPGFAQSLSLADEVILLDIYPAREQPIPGVTSGLILERLQVPGRIVSKAEFPKYVDEHVKEGIFMTMGAGDIDRFVPVFTEMLKTRR